MRRQTIVGRRSQGGGGRENEKEEGKRKMDTVEYRNETQKRWEICERGFGFGFEACCYWCVLLVLSLNTAGRGRTFSVSFFTSLALALLCSASFFLFFSLYISTRFSTYLLISSVW
jgi:hypothetical protein